jgi:hypothetical protein
MVFKTPAEGAVPAQAPASKSKSTIVPASMSAKKTAFERTKAAEKALKTILSRAKVSALPPLEKLLRNKSGEVIRVSDVGIFVGTPKNEVLAWLSEILPSRNIINGSAEVDLKGIIDVGVEIVRSGKLYQIPHVAKLPDGDIQCTSGRHRLGFFALAYGPDTLIPFYSEQMTLNEARDAVVYANDTRTIGARERAEHAVMQAASGDAAISQDELYERMRFNKTEMVAYCVYSIINRKHPVALEFGVSDSAAKGECLTTLSTVKNYWRISVDCDISLSKSEFDKKLENSTVFLNRLVEEMQKMIGFQADQHLAAMPLAAIGKYYRTATDIGKSIDQLVVEKLAATVVGLGPIARVSSENTYKAILAKMK